jgi:hypothetical protein
LNDQSLEWRWADADGVQHSASTWTLTNSLCSGALPAYTLVWRRGWAEWLPACRVAELKGAVPERLLEESVTPKQNPHAENPPTPPLEYYAMYRRSRGGAGSIVINDLDEPPSSRSPQPTLVDEDISPPATLTLRPPGAVPPPPRGLPSAPRAVRPKLDTLDELSATPESPRALGSPVHSGGSAPLGSPANTRSSSSDAPGVPARPTPMASPAGIGRSPRSRRLKLTIALGAIAALAALAVLVAGGDPDSTPANAGATNPTTVATPAPSEPAEPSCKLIHPARPISTSIVASISPHLATLATGDAAIGVAAERTAAAGFVVSPRKLDVRRVFSQRAPKPLIGVVPSVGQDGVTFHLDHAGAPLRSVRTVGTRPPFALGLSKQGLSRQAGGRSAELLWPLSAKEKITEPRIASVDAVGHAVTFRAGGQSGNVLVGWLAADGSRKTDLGSVDAGGALLGTPAIAANGQAITVAFAARANERDDWGLRIATAPHGSVPRLSHAFKVPAGGPGGGAISPALAGFKDGWLLQWTEGTPGSYRVRVQVLNQELEPVGNPIQASPSDLNAGQGAVWLGGSFGLSLFLVTQAGTLELWGAGLECK